MRDSRFARAKPDFRIETSRDRHCELIEQLHLGFATPVVGCLLDRLLSRLLPMDEIRRHIAEEGERLAQVLTSGGTI